jgi:hypothetical protein
MTYTIALSVAHRTLRLCAWLAFVAAVATGLLGVHPDALAASVLRVGPQELLKLPSEAARHARDGDTVQIQAGIYEGDAAVWTQTGLTIQGVGGMAHLRANGANAQGKAIWVIQGANTVVENIEFSGATVPDRNGAGIRQEGPGLVVRRCYFHHNENGILGGSNPNSDVVIEHSEFAYNGFGDGQSHNLYIGAVGSFTLRYSYSHHAVVGHEVKSRALKNYIMYNRIMDEADGRSSYAIDLPNGGLSFVIGNAIQQGPANQNRTVVSYGAEGLPYPLNALFFINNTVVNDDPAGVGRFIYVQAFLGPVKIINNIFSGPGVVLTGTSTAELRNNMHLPATDFVNPSAFDYRLKAGSAAIDHGVEPGIAYGLALRPVFQYVHKAQKRTRSSSALLDLGAFEYEAPGSPSLWRWK